MNIKAPHTFSNINCIYYTPTFSNLQDGILHEFTFSNLWKLHKLHRELCKMCGKERYAKNKRIIRQAERIQPNEV